MSKYTTEVRYICESFAGLKQSVGYNSTAKTIQDARGKIFDFSYPIFDEAYRSVLETKILKHFYTREIGEETVGLWKLRLDTRLNEIMPYYNQLYRSELLEFNPLYDTNITRQRDGSNSGTKYDTGSNSATTRSDNTLDRTSGSIGKNTTVADTKENGTKVQDVTTNNEHRDLYSDTPQGALTNVDKETYLTNARKVLDDNTNNIVDDTTLDTKVNREDNTDLSENEHGTNITNGSTFGSSTMDSIINNTEQYLETVSGKQGTESYASLLMKYRSTFLNIDVQVINELNDLFMNLW